MPDLTLNAAALVALVALVALGVFALAYGFVITEEFTRLRKSEPVVLAAGVLWLLVALSWQALSHQREVFLSTAGNDECAHA